MPEPDGANEGARATGVAMKIVRDWSRLRAQWRTLTALGLFIVGIMLVLLGWYGAAHTNIMTEQIPYLISGGLLGLGLIIVAGILSVQIAIERDNAEFRRSVVQALTNTASHTASPSGTAHPATPGPVSNGHVFVVPGGRSFHLPGCPIVEGKEGTEALMPAQAAVAGFAPCKLCGD